jgi:D-alanine-D-alanine ligase
VSGPRRIALLFGGTSVEHEVSVVSARGVAAALDPARFDVLPVGITTEGRWLPPSASRKVLDSRASRVEDAASGARLLVDPGVGLMTLEPAGRPEPLAVDAVFSVVHGWGGEDGRFQGLLEVAGIPLVGPGVLGSAVGMDKQVAKALFQERDIPVGPWRALRRERWQARGKAAESEIVQALGLPLFVKPANGGSSVGINKVREAGSLSDALAIAFEHDAKAVIERALDAREIECAVLGNDRPEVSVCGEIVPSREFYDYESKYEDGTSELIIPAAIPAATGERIRALALAAFEALDLAGMARVDFFVDRGTGEPFLNEVNTLPGFTPISMYPKLWEASGLSYPDLLARLIDLAVERFESERRRRTRRS